MGQREHKGAERNFEVVRCVHYLDYDDVFTDYICISRHQFVQFKIYSLCQFSLNEVVKIM